MPSLCDLHGKSIALVCHLAGNSIVLKGEGAYTREGGKGVLRIKVSDPAASEGQPEFLLHEEKWQDEIQSGATHQCDYMLSLKLNQADDCVT